MDNELERKDLGAQDMQQPQESQNIPETQPVQQPAPNPGQQPYYPNQPYQQPYYGMPPRPAQPMPQYQPAPGSQYRWVNPNIQAPQPQPQPVATEKPEKKKRGVFKKILAIVLAVVIALGCAIAGGVVGAKLAGKGGEENIFQNFPGNSGVLEGDRENTTIDINKVDTSKQMTAAEVYATNVNSTVGITTAIKTNYWGYTTTSAASGSGFIYSDDGYIVTNYHVVEGSSSITVSMYDGSSMKAKMVGYDESNDVAVLKIDATNLKPVIIGNSDNLNVGDPVLAIGNPLGELTFSLTAGTVSALDREVTFSGGITMNLIQTDCAINSGNSGGALFNLYGEVIGVTNAKYSGNSSSGATIDNIGFAIPMNHVRSIVDSIIQNGHVVTPYIGVMVADVGEESLGYGMPQGASVQAVVEGSPAEKAGLQTSDIVTQIDGKVISGKSDLKKAVTAAKPGDTMKLTVWRKGETMELTLTVGEQTSTEVQEEQQQQQVYPNIPGFSFPWG